MEYTSISDEYVKSRTLQEYGRSSSVTNRNFGAGIQGAETGRRLLDREEVLELEDLDELLYNGAQLIVKPHCRRFVRSDMVLEGRIVRLLSVRYHQCIMIQRVGRRGRQPRVRVSILQYLE